MVGDGTVKQPVQYYFLDTNFIGQMSGLKNDALVDWIIGLLCSPGQPPPVPVVTHFSRMEALGITAPTFQYQIPRQEIAKKDLRAIFGGLRAAATSFFSSHPDLTEDNILARIETKRSYTHPKFIDCGLFRRHVEIPKEKVAAYRKDLCELLSVNAIHAFDYPKAVRSDVHRIHLLALIEEMKAGRNVCLLRCFRPFWDNRNKELESRRYSSVDIEQFEEAMRLKPSADLVDLEIMHYMLFGYFDGTCKSQVIGFTSDKFMERLHKRIRVFKGIVAAAGKLLEAMNERTDILSLKPGILGKFDNDPASRGFLDVANIPPF